MAVVSSPVVAKAGLSASAEALHERAAEHVAVLSDAPMRKAYQVVDVVSPAGQPEWADRLAEIGFLTGEQVQVLSRGVAGGDPIAVRVGTSTFALRRAEAACVRVAPRSA